jgi:putative transposase
MRERSPRQRRPDPRLAGQSYDNALAETVNGLYKAELIHRRPRWRTAEEVELATADWVAWWNHRRLHSATDYLPPAEYERAYWRQQAEPIEAA